MKRIITLVVAMLVLATAASAQREIGFTQTLCDLEVNTIVIHSGWNVTFVPRTDDTTFLVLSCHSNDECYELADSNIFEYHNKTLTLRRASHSLWGRQVEIHTNFQDKQITLMPGATVFADSLYIAQKDNSISLKPGSILRVGRLHCIDSDLNTRITVDNADLTVDSLTGASAMISIAGNGQVSINHYCQQKLYINLEKGHDDNCYTFPDKSVVVNGHSVPKTLMDTIHHIQVCDIDKLTWKRAIHLYLDLGIKISATSTGYNRATGWMTHISGAPLASPYAQLTTIELNLPLVTQFQINPKWTATTGLNLRAGFSPTCHKVTVDGNGYLQLADTASHFSNLASTLYLGIPIKFRWQPTRKPRFYFSADLFAGVLLGGRMTQYSIAHEHILQHSSVKTSYLNPFILELGLDIHQSVLPCIGTLRLYTNLLPDYRKAPELPKCHSFGFQINF